MAKTPKDHFLVILCGGTGPRLWPLSRADKPKQFLPLLSKKTLYQETLARALKISSPQKIIVVSNNKYRSLLLSQTPKSIPRSNLLFEPLKKNTAMAMVWAAAHISQISPEATLTHFASDHYITPLKALLHDLHLSTRLAKTQKCLVAIGTRPTFPNPGYGYILTKKNSSSSALSVTRFIEKPKIPQARRLIESKNCFWNANLYTWDIPTFTKELKSHAPHYYRLLLSLQKDPSSKNICKIYSQSYRLSIDKALSEKTKNLKLIPASFAWSDIGEWGLLKKALAPSAKNIILTGKEKTLTHQTENCLISHQGSQLLGLVGLKDCSVVTTSDAILVCSHSASYQIRRLVAKIVKKKNLAPYFLKSPPADK